MKILFVCSGNSKIGISPILINQAESLMDYDSSISVEYYTIHGKGIRGYLSNIYKLRAHLKYNKYDIVHAHFSLTAFVAALAGAKSLVVSLMGWNVRKTWLKYTIKLFNILFFKACIVKSNQMKVDLNMKSLYVLANGVDLKKFAPMDKMRCREKLNWEQYKKYILFPANIDRPIKNYPLAKSVIENVNSIIGEEIELIVLDNTPNELMPTLYNASDAILFTSKAEGSPNVIKEAMACNSKIVTTNVGDTPELLHDVNGAYISDAHSKDELSDYLIKALNDSNSDTRNHILHLDSSSVAKKLIDIYKSVL